MTRQHDDTITVVIPTFNRRELLQVAVESVLQEDRVPIRLHIFDNASTDQTETYARALIAANPRVSYTRRPENIGAIGNYSQALATVSTEYFVPLADDDWLLPDFLFDAHAVLQQHADLGAAIFVTEARDAQGALVCTYPTSLDKLRFGILQPREHLSDWLRYGHHAWSSVLWRTRTMECLGPPYLHTGLPSDVDFQAQIFCHHPVYLCNRPGAVYSLHQSQASGGFDVSHIRSWARLFKRLDREIARQNLLDRGEYLPLRQMMRDRYRVAWNAPAKASLSEKDRVSAAYLAGFGLGDWETAFSLIESTRAESDLRAVPPDLSVVQLPRVGSTRLGMDSASTDSVTKLVASVLIWMKGATEALAQLEQVNARMQTEKAELTVALAAAAEREELVRSVGEQNDRRRIAAEAALESLRRHPVLRAMKKLGLGRLSKAK